MSEECSLPRNICAVVYYQLRLTQLSSAGKKEQSPDPHNLLENQLELKMAVFCICGVCIPYSVLFPTLLLVLKSIYSWVMKLFGKEVDQKQPVCEGDSCSLNDNGGGGTSCCSSGDSNGTSSGDVLPKGEVQSEVPYLVDQAMWLKTIAQDEPTFVKFTAKWCKPCKAIEPVFCELYKDNFSKASFLKIDVDEFEDIAAENGAMTIPLFVCYRKGKLVSSLKGKDEDALRNFVKEGVVE